jgi:hypothetical protein
LAGEGDLMSKVISGEGCDHIHQQNSYAQGRTDQQQKLT